MFAERLQIHALCEALRISVLVYSTRAEVLESFWEKYANWKTVQLLLSYHRYGGHYDLMIPLSSQSIHQPARYSVTAQTVMLSHGSVMQAHQTNTDSAGKLIPGISRISIDFPGFQFDFPDFPIYRFTGFH